MLSCPLCSPAGRSRSNYPSQSHGMFGLNAGEDIVLVAACSRAVKKGRRPVAVNSLAGLPIYQRDRAVVIRFEDIRVIRLHMEPPVRIVVPPQPCTFRKYCAQSEKRVTSPNCKQTRLPAFFGSTPDQAPKAAKLAVLIPGPGMLVNVRNAPRVVIPPPIRNAPCFGV